MRLPDLPLWRRLEGKHTPLGFELEMTARCNLDCRHCYVNMPANDARAAARELAAVEIQEIGRQAVELGALWCTLTGGEPLLRPDFAEIYLGLKRLGLLVSIYTNATLIREEHIALFRKYPPRDIEITVYGATAGTYERITRRQGSYARFRHGLALLLDSGIKVRLKTMALRSNLQELPEIARFCRERTKDFYRFDPFLNLRTDRDPERNREIASERLLPEEIAFCERGDAERQGALEKRCDRLIEPLREDFSYEACLACSRQDRCESFLRLSRRLICGAGLASFFVAHDGAFRLCASLCAPGTTYDMRQGSLRQAWEEFVPSVRESKAKSAQLLNSCRSCPIVNLCFNCPATADLECGDPEAVIPYFCSVAKARRANLDNTSKKTQANQIPAQKE